jgi:heat shock protein HslJ
MIRIAGALPACSFVGALTMELVGTTAQVATPTAQEAVPPGRWAVVGTVSTDGGVTVPADPSDYTVEFFPGERTVIYPAGQQDPGGKPDGRLALQLDCNEGSADYHLKSGRLRIIPRVTSMRGCRHPSLGESFGDWLLAVTRFAWNAEELIFFLEGGGRLRFAPALTAEAAAPKARMVNTAPVPTGTWALQVIIGASGRELVPENSADYTVEFVPGGRSVFDPHPDVPEDPASIPDGMIGLRLDCNLGSADYFVEGNQLSVGSIVSTNMGCRTPELGLTYSDLLRTVTAYRQEGDERIFFLEGEGQLRFAPAPPRHEPASE